MYSCLRPFCSTMHIYRSVLESGFGVTTRVVRIRSDPAGRLDRREIQISFDDEREKNGEISSSRRLIVMIYFNVRFSGIIHTITIMTIHCSRQLPRESYLDTAISTSFFVLCLTTLYYFLNAIIEGPGYLDPKWMPVIYSFIYLTVLCVFVVFFVFNNGTLWCIETIVYF